MVRPLQPALKTVSDSAAWRPYEACGTWSEALGRRTQSGVAAPAIPISVSAPTIGETLATTSADGNLGCNPVGVLAHLAAAAISTSSAVPSAPLLYQDGRRSTARSAAIPQRPPSGRQLAASDDARDESLLDRGVRSAHLGGLWFIYVRL